MPDVQGHHPTSIEETVAANVRHLRTARELTQAELAEKTDGRLNEQRVWALENGRRRFTVADLTALANALAVDPAVLMSTDPAGLSLAPAPISHAVTLDTGAVEVVQAHSTEVSDGWLHFFLDNERVFFAPASRVLCVRTAKRAGESGKEVGE